MTIIFSNREDPDSLLIKDVWLECIKEFNSVYLEIKKDSENWENLVDMALSAEEDLLILIGHGTSRGLLSPDWNDYVVHSGNVGLIKAKKVVCIWCYASSFCMNNNVPSFSTSMFVSNPKEAKDNDLGEFTQEEIDNTVRQIYYEILNLVRKEVPLNLWVISIGARMDIENPIDRFNRQGLFYLEEPQQKPEEI